MKTIGTLSAVQLLHPRQPTNDHTRIITSPYADVELAEVTVPEFALGRAWARGDRPAIIDSVTGRTFGYRVPAEAVERRCRGAGRRRGRPRATYSPSVPPTAPSSPSPTTRRPRRAVVSTLNPLTTGHDMARQLQHAGARWLVTAAALFEEKGRVAAAAGGVRRTFVVGQAGGATPWTSLLDNRRPTPAVEVGLDDVAALLYPSGTTGLPKGVVLTHRSLVASLCQTLAAQEVGEEDVVVAVLPMFHMYGMQSSMNLALHAGATVVLMPRFDPETLLRVLQDHRVTRADLVRRCCGAGQAPGCGARRPDQPAGDHIGGGPSRRRTGPGLRQTPGLPGQAGLRNDRAGRGYARRADRGRDDPESIGPPLPGVECRVIDVRIGEDVGPGQPGELRRRVAGDDAGLSRQLRGECGNHRPRGMGPHRRRGHGG